MKKRRPERRGSLQHGKPFLSRVLSSPKLRTPAFRAWSLLGLWILAYSLLSALGTRTDEGKSGGTTTASAATDAKQATANDTDGADASDPGDELDRASKTFNFPIVNINYMRTWLRDDLGLELDCPESAKGLTMKGLGLGGKAFAAILLELLRQHEYSFFRQGKAIHVVKAVFKETTEGVKGQGGVKSYLMRTSFQAQSGEPLDFWVQTDSLVRLRLTALPLYGEMNTGREVGLSLEARRDQQPWFQQELETSLEQQASVEMKGRQKAWCLITPKAISGQTITLEVEFYHVAGASSEQ
jgi:hypothetical protein